MKKILMTLSMMLLMSFGLFSQTLTFQDLKNGADELNNMCPFMLDSETRFDRCSVLEKESEFIIQYDYTLINYTFYQIKERLESIKEIQEKTLIKSVKENGALSLFRSNGITFQYVYYDKNHKLLFLIKIDKDKYKD